MEEVPCDMCEFANALDTRAEPRVGSQKKSSTFIWYCENSLTIYLSWIVSGFGFLARKA